MATHLRSKLTKLFLTPLLLCATLSFGNEVWEKRFEQFLCDVRRCSINTMYWDHLNWCKYHHNQCEQLPIENEEAFRKAVSCALYELGDHHSFLINKHSAEVAETTPCFIDDHFITVSEGVGIISIPGILPCFTSNNTSDHRAQDWVNRFQSELDAISHDVSKGWIIDLRENKGGAKFPMLAALSRFLQNSTVGGLSSPTRNKMTISFDGQTFTYSDSYNNCVYDKKYPFNTNTLPIFVLIGKKTASAAEFTALTLRRNINTLLIGKSSHGVASSNLTLALPDSLGFYALTAKLYLDEHDNPLISRIVHPDIESKLEGDDLIKYCIEQFSE